MKEYKSFFKTVGGSEGERCHYSTRLDTYGCGCQHDCSYCYAKSLLSFRGLWSGVQPSVADVDKIRARIRKLPEGAVVRLGGMTDCFQPLEAELGVTYELIKALNERRIGYLIVTKSALVAEDKYLDVLDRKLAHVQISVTTLDDERAAGYEHASAPSARVAAIRKLQDHGIDVAIRLSPVLPEYMDFEKLNGQGIRKAVVEFLRVNGWITKWFDIDYSQYTISSGGYRHLPYAKKREILERIRLPVVTVCEDVPAHYELWRDCFNPDPDDCCALGR